MPVNVTSEKKINNRAYLAICLRHFANTQTSCEIPNPALPGEENG